MLKIVRLKVSDGKTMYGYRFSKYLDCHTLTVTGRPGCATRWHILENNYSHMILEIQIIIVNSFCLKDLASLFRLTTGSNFWWVPFTPFICVVSTLFIDSVWELWKVNTKITTFWVFFFSSVIAEQSFGGRTVEILTTNDCL